MTHDSLRPLEIEEFTNRYLIHRLSHLLVRKVAHSSVTPNMLSLMSLLCAVLAAASFFHFDESVGFTVLGFFFLILRLVFDGADGQLARARQIASRQGMMVDAICDISSEVVLYVGLSLKLVEIHGNYVWLLTLAAVASHLAQTGAYEMQRWLYEYWVYGKRTSLPQVLFSHRAANEVAAVPAKTPIVMKLERLFGLLQCIVAGISMKALQQRIQASERLDDVSRNRQRTSYREAHSELVKLWSIMCVNYRYVLLFAAYLVGKPLLFLLAEITLYNAMQWFLVKRAKTISVTGC